MANGLIVLAITCEHFRISLGSGWIGNSASFRFINIRRMNIIIIIIKQLCELPVGARGGSQ